jgi:type I restriction enzyme S subunit
MVFVPSDELLTKFSEAVGAMMMGAQEGPIQELAALRDTLLPRLISGQLRIPDSPEVALN